MRPGWRAVYWPSVRKRGCMLTLGLYMPAVNPSSGTGGPRGAAREYWTPQAPQAADLVCRPGHAFMVSGWVPFPGAGLGLLRAQYGRRCNRDSDHLARRRCQCIGPRWCDQLPWAHVCAVHYGMGDPATARAHGRVRPRTGPGGAAVQCATSTLSMQSATDAPRSAADPCFLFSALGPPARRRGTDRDTPNAVGRKRTLGYRVGR